MYVLMYNIRVVGLYPYKGLADLHYDFGRVDSVAAILWRQDAVAVSVVNFRIWTPIGCAVFFFLMFGFTAEARTQYKLAFTWVARRAGVSLFEDTLRPVADSDLWDDFRVNVFSANRAEFYGGGTPQVHVGELVALGPSGLPAYRVERTAPKADIVVMYPIGLSGYRAVLYLVVRFAVLGVIACSSYLPLFIPKSLSCIRKNLPH